MHRTPALLLFGAAGVVAACSGGNPTEVRNDPNQFPVVAHWTATAAAIAPATFSCQLTFEQHLGVHSDVTFIVTGPPNTAFQ